MSIDGEKKINFITTQILKIIGGLAMMLIATMSWLAIQVFTDMRDSVTHMEAQFESISIDVGIIKVNLGRVEENVKNNTQEILELRHRADRGK